MHEFETAMANEPSVFELLKFYCTLILIRLALSALVVKELSECVCNQQEIYFPSNIGLISQKFIDKLSK